MNIKHNSINTDAKRADKIFSDLIKTYYKHTGKNIPTGFKPPSFNYATYGGNISAIASFLNLCMLRVKVHETNAGPGEEMNPEGGSVLTTAFMDQQLLIELIDPNYNRVNEQVELQQLIEETGGVYLVVSDFADFMDQLSVTFFPLQINNSD